MKERRIGDQWKKMMWITMDRKVKMMRKDNMRKIIMIGNEYLMIQANIYSKYKL